MPVYAVDQKRDMLVEFKSEKAFNQVAQEIVFEKENEDWYTRYKPIHYTQAHKWVKDGYNHETGLYIDDGRIRYAKEDLG